ncbi:hypothetical protein KC336_g11336 [Hortaea werneckii]|nr:hypothetical protein KC336_g11336 [Hortaea werneckii]
MLSTIETPPKRTMPTVGVPLIVSRCHQPHPTAPVAESGRLQPVPAKDVWETVSTLIASELRVGIDVVFLVKVISPLEIEDVGSGNDRGEPTTQLGRKVPNDTDAVAADEEMFSSEDVCGLRLLKMVVMEAPAEAGIVEEISESREVVKGSTALLFGSVVKAGGRRELDVLSLLDTVSDDVRPPPEVSSMDDAEVVTKDAVGLVDRIVELLVPKGTGEVNVKLVARDSAGAALVVEASVALNVVPDIVDV